MNADHPSQQSEVAATPRGRARREQLLAAVTEDLATNGLVDFSLRRAARAAGATHKVLIYHFGTAETLLGLAMRRLRERRISGVLPEAAAEATLAGRVRALWRGLAEDETGLRVIDQAIGLAMYDPERYAHLATDAADMYVSPLVSLFPPGWSSVRKREVAEFVMATMRGFLMEWRTTRNHVRIEAGLAALSRALDAEEARTA
jgi:AcrR family transcriptional regulator